MAEKEGNEIKDLLKKSLSSTGELIAAVAKKTVSAGKNATEKATELSEEAKAKLIEVMDHNGNGEIDIEDVIIMSLKVPFVRIDRASFLRKELSDKVLAETVEKAVATNPMTAGVSLDVIDKVADDVIKAERLKVSGISTALGVPGGVAMVATIPADIAQYYGYMLRAMQELLYLYGFPEIDIEAKEGILDSATMNTLILCMGIMYGTAGANNALKAMAKALGTGVEKKLLNTALTKGTFYPLVKSVAKWFGVKMTKSIFAGFFKTAIPIIGGVLGGGITFVSFKPCCDRLKASLRDTMLSNPNHVSTTAEDMILSRIVEGVVVDVDENSIIAASADYDSDPEMFLDNETDSESED